MVLGASPLAARPLGAFVILGVVAEKSKFKPFFMFPF